MEILDLENKRNDLLDNLSHNPSNKKISFLLHKFYSLLLQYSEQNDFESYFLEFIKIYIKNLKSYSPSLTNPFITEKIINQIHALNKLEFLVSFKEQLIEVSDKVRNDLSLLKNLLNGKTSDTVSNQKAFFPLLEQSIFNDETPIGILETFSIQINKSKGNNFLIIPSEKEIEERLIEQIKNSWDAALSIVKKYKKNIDKNHEVIISFDKKEGIYEGNSLGTALTIGFIEKLLNFYNTSIIVNIKPNVSFTGGMESSGKVLNISKEIIEKKVECVFYSPIEIFVVPKEDEVFANEKLNKLKNEFPKRNLSIIGVKDLNDLLDRRKIVDIKRQPVIVRTAKFSRKNWVSLTLVVVLFLVILATGWLDFDTNAAQVEFKNDTAYIENKNGKALWTYKTMGSDALLFNYGVRFTDINNDNTNEVIISDEYYDQNKQNSNYGRIACFDNSKNLIWEYNFHDKVSSTTFEGINIYRLYIIGIIVENGRKVVYVMAKNRNLYPCAIFSLDAKTGKRIDSLNTLWNAGTITNALIGDFNNDNKRELVTAAIHNGFQRSVLISVNLDKLQGQTPAPSNYTFANMKAADLNAFILLPKSDYSDLYYRYDMPLAGSLIYSSVTEQFKFDLIEGVTDPSQYAHLNFVFDNNLHLVYLGCGDDFQMKRDSLVAHGTLKPPYSNTPEYFKQLKEQIRYWNGDEFITARKYFAELKKQWNLPAGRQAQIN